MYVDKENVFEMGMDCTATTDETVWASGCIDLGVSDRDVGAGRQMFCCINVTTIFSSSDTATLTFQLLEDASTGIDSQSIVLSQTEAFAISTMTVGRELIVIPVPPGVALRYLGLGVVTGDFNTTTGTIDAYLTLEPQTNG